MSFVRQFEIVVAHAAHVWPIARLVAVAGLCLSMVPMVLADADEEAAPAAPAARGVRQIVIDDKFFDQLVFGGSVRQPDVVANGSDEVAASSKPTTDGFRLLMERRVAAELRWLDSRLSLTEAQKKKLQLAARGDIVQHISRAEELRPKVTSQAMTPEQWRTLQEQLQPLRHALQVEMTGETSLFRKTLRKVLTDEQRVRFEVLERERQAAIIESALRKTERVPNGMKLTSETRQKFAELVLDHGRIPQNVGPYGQFIVLLAASQLRDRVKPLLTPAEWEQFEWQVGLAKRYAAEIESSGHWTPSRLNDDDDATADSKKD